MAPLWTHYFVHPYVASMTLRRSQGMKIKSSLDETHKYKAFLDFLLLL